MPRVLASHFSLFGTELLKVMLLFSSKCSPFSRPPSRSRLIEVTLMMKGLIIPAFGFPNQITKEAKAVLSVRIADFYFPPCNMFSLINNNGYKKTHLFYTQKNGKGSSF